MNSRFALRPGLVAALALTACGGSPRPRAAPSGAAPLAAPAPPATASTPTPEIAPPAPGDQRAAREAKDVVAAALARVSALRHLAATGPVEGRILSRAAMAKNIRARLGVEIPESVVRGSAAILLALGLVPPDFDYAASIQTLMTSQLAGFYDPTTKTMYLAKDLEGPERRATLSHELVHALQDQHYGLAERIEYRPDESDVQSAVHSLAEGDATSLMLDDLLADSGKTALDLPETLLGVQVRAAIELSEDVADVPSILKRSIVAPYVDGIELVHALRRRGGWAAVDAVWKEPPATTEQLLHIDKLDAREGAETIALPVPPPEGPKELLYRDVLGEQSVRLVLEEWLPRQSAGAAAADWAGDRVAVYASGATTAVAWHVRWDNRTAAKRGFEAFARGALSNAPARRAKSAVAKAARSGTLCKDREGLGPFAVTLRDRDVAIVLGPSAVRGAAATGSAACVRAQHWAQRLFGST